jgi:hypothetical protein
MEFEMVTPPDLFAGVPIGAPIGFCAVVVVFAVVLLKARRRPERKSDRTGDPPKG